MIIPYRCCSERDLSFSLIFFVLSTLPYFHSPAPPTPPGFLRHVRNHRKCVLMGPAFVDHYFKMRQDGPLSRNLYLNSSKILCNKLGNFNGVYCTIYKIVYGTDFRVTAPRFSCVNVSQMKRYFLC
jgi:hypothetical protein